MSAGNIITNSGKQIILDRAFNTVPTYTAPIQFEVGIGTSTPSAGDTTLGTVAALDTIDDCDSDLNFDYQSNMSTSVNNSKYKQGTGAVNLIKDGTSTTPFVEGDGTFTSRNFTDKNISFWLYVDDAGTLAKIASASAVIIRYGSDASNYYYWNIPKTSIAVGWTWLSGYNTTNATGTTGSPVIGSCDYFRIGFTLGVAADTWVAGKVILDFIALKDYSRSFQPGYAVIPPDETLDTVKILCYLDDKSANGNTLTEYGIFNSDIPKTMFSRTVHNSIIKTSSVLVIYTEAEVF